MDIDVCTHCRGRGYTDHDEGNNWEPHYVRRHCKPCEGRGCAPIAPNVVGACPACGNEIPLREIVPSGSCRHCGKKLTLQMPGCFRAEHRPLQHSLFHDNWAGAGVSVQLPQAPVWRPGPAILPAEPPSEYLFPDDDRRVVHCAETAGGAGSPGIHCRSLEITISVVKNQDGEIVERVASKATVDVRQTYQARP